MVQGAWWAMVHEVTKDLDTTEWLSKHVSLQKANLTQVLEAVLSMLSI